MDRTTHIMLLRQSLIEQQGLCRKEVERVGEFERLGDLAEPEYPECSAIQHNKRRHAEANSRWLRALTELLDRIPASDEDDAYFRNWRSQIIRFEEEMQGEMQNLLLSGFPVDGHA
jgi:hypothetical protein